MTSDSQPNPEHPDAPRIRLLSGVGLTEARGSLPRLPWYLDSRMHYEHPPPGGTGRDGRVGNTCSVRQHFYPGGGFPLEPPSVVKVQRQDSTSVLICQEMSEKRVIEFNTTPPRYLLT